MSLTLSLRLALHLIGEQMADQAVPSLAKSEGSQSRHCGLHVFTQRHLRHNPLSCQSDRARVGIDH